MKKAAQFVTFVLALALASTASSNPLRRCHHPICSASGLFWWWPSKRILPTRRLIAMTYLARKRRAAGIYCARWVSTLDQN